MTTPSPVSYEEGLARRLSRPGNALTRLSTPWRRALVVAAALAAASAAALAWLLDGPHQLLAGVPLFLLLLLNVPLSLVTRSITDLPERMLDERVRGVRDRAARRALQTVFWALNALALLALIGNPGLLEEDGVPVTVQMTTIQLVVTLEVLTFTAMGLPSWFLAWTQRPEPDDDPVPAPAAAEPAGPLPWRRIGLMGAGWGIFMIVFTLAGRPDDASPLLTVVVYLIGGALFALAMAAYFHWARRRL